MNKQAANIVLLDVRKLCSYTDYIVLCSADSSRQLDAIQAEMEAISKQEGVRTRREGTSDSGWILLDAGDIVVHMLSAEDREYYQLDELWGKAQALVKIQ